MRMSSAVRLFKTHDIGPPDSAIDVENGSLHGEENCTVTCTICLSPYQNEDW